MVVSLTLTLKGFVRVFSYFWKLGGIFLQLHCYRLFGWGQFVHYPEILDEAAAVLLSTGVTGILGTSHPCFRGGLIWPIKKKGFVGFFTFDMKFWENGVYLTLFPKSLWTNISMKQTSSLTNSLTYFHYFTILLNFA